MRQTSVFLLLVLLLIYSVSSTAGIQYFDNTSYQKILHNKKNSDFILILWSLDCPPCIEELPVIFRFYKNNPDMDIVMVSTDNASRLNEISTLMDENGLSDVEQWIFQTDLHQRIRYSIDPQWYGELPRSYFYIAGKRSRSFSGRLNREQLQGWVYSRKKLSAGVKKL